MQTVRTSEELAFSLGQLRQTGTVALVPTMGALHAGHLALIAEAKKRADKVVATIFVNPTQFNDAGDLERYPRSEAEDAAKLEAAGCDLLWAPGAEDIYPDGLSATVHAADIAERWEGEHRPGHFDGVATVVSRLLRAVKPDVALFGEKDFQQLAVIRQMAADLAIPVEIVGVPIVRDNDGLALSSRNALLSPDERARAVALPNALETARDSIRNGSDIARSLRKAKQALVDAGFLKVDYVALVDAYSLEPLDEPRGEMRLIAAATIGTTRLIDNIMVESR